MKEEAFDWIIHSFVIDVDDDVDNKCDGVEEEVVAEVVVGRGFLAVNAGEPASIDLFASRMDRFSLLRPLTLIRLFMRSSRLKITA